MAVGKCERRVLGLSCGPAADGAEAAILCTGGQGDDMTVRQEAVLHVPMPRDLRRRLTSAMTGWAQPARDFASLDRDVGTFLSEAGAALMKRNQTGRRDLAGAGVLGVRAAYVQPGTESPPAMLELAGAAQVAGRLGVPVASGFAASDLAGGGVGGPVTAWPDWLLLHDARLSRVVVRLGAVASISFVGSGAPAGDVVAYDVGPGTALSDGLMARLYETSFDGDGAAAARGTVHGEMLNELEAGEYLHRAAPKLSCAGDWLGGALERVELMAGKHHVQAKDLVTTVTELTARTVARDVLRLTERPHEVILCGGGARNIHLAGRIRTLLSPCSTYTIQRYGYDLRGYTAVCAAVLAAARLDEWPAHCPTATGAAAARVLGAVSL